MNNLTHAPQVTEGMATEAIMTASRANETRQVWTGSVGGEWMKVSFTRLALDVGNGQRFEACLRGADGVVIALAIVDDDDI